MEGFERIRFASMANNKASFDSKGIVKAAVIPDVRF